MNKIRGILSIIVLTLVLTVLTVNSFGQAILVDIDSIVDNKLSLVTSGAVDGASLQYKIPLSLTLSNSSKVILPKDIYNLTFKPSAGTITDFKNTNGVIIATLNVDKTVYNKVTVSSTIKYSQDVCDGIEAAKKEFLSRGELDALDLIDFSFQNSKIAMSSPEFFTKELQTSPTELEYINKFLVGNEFVEPIYSSAVAKFIEDNIAKTTIQAWLERYIDSFAGVDFSNYPNIAANILKAHTKITCFRKLSVQELTSLDIALPAKALEVVPTITPKPEVKNATPRTGGQSIQYIIPSIILTAFISIKLYKRSK